MEHEIFLAVDVTAHGFIYAHNCRLQFSTKARQCEVLAGKEGRKIVQEAIDLIQPYRVFTATAGEREVIRTTFKFPEVCHFELVSIPPEIKEVDEKVMSIAVQRAIDKKHESLHFQTL